MKPFYLIILLIYVSSYSQKWPSEEFALKYNYQEVVGDTIGLGNVIKDGKYPMYPNGKQGIITFISNTTRYPSTTLQPTNNGKVNVEFIVNTKGKVEDIVIIGSAGKPFDDEAIRVFKKMEKWIPGVENGKLIRVRYKQTISFK